VLRTPHHASGPRAEERQGYHLLHWTTPQYAGFGQVAPTAGDIPKALALPTGGLGVRYQLTQKYPMHLRFDYSWGRDGPLFYFGAGEAF